MPRHRPLIGAALATSVLGLLAAGLQVSTAASPVIAAVSSQELSQAEARSAARAYLDDHRALVKAAARDAFAVVDTVATKQGLTYVAFERTHRGLPVVGGDFVVSVGTGGQVTDVASGQDQPVRLSSLTPKISRGQASATADDHAPRAGRVRSTRLVVLAQGTPRLAWETHVTGVRSTGVPVDRAVWVGAVSGDVLQSQDFVMHGSGTGYHNGSVAFGTTDNQDGTFTMADPDRYGQVCSPYNGTVFVEPFSGPDDVWGDGTGQSLETGCVDAMYGMRQTWDMLDDWLGRDGVNGDGTGYSAQVGHPLANAFWTTGGTTFGTSADYQRLLTSLDIVGHENGHGVFYSTPGGFVGDNETDGMNEATSDIFGTLTEHYAANPHDAPDFALGEEADPYGTGAIRLMYDPGLKGDPGCWSTSLKTMGAHRAAGPLNHWFYLLARGSDPTSGPASPTCNGTSVTGVGLRTAADVFYHGLLRKTSYWDHSAARKATLQAAVDLYGTSDCTVYDTVRKAWNAISVPAQPGETLCDGTHCSEYTLGGTVAPGEAVLRPDAEGFFSTAGRFTGCLTGPPGATLRLTLQRRLKYSWVDLATASGTGTVEVTHVGPSTSYRWRVETLSGAPAPYTLVYDTP